MMYGWIEHRGCFFEANELESVLYRQMLT